MRGRGALISWLSTGSGSSAGGGAGGGGGGGGRGAGGGGGRFLRGGGGGGGGGGGSGLLRGGGGGGGGGGALIERCLEEARGFGFRTCYLETLTGMDAAQRLYERVGFKRIEGAMGRTGHFSCDTYYAIAV